MKQFVKYWFPFVLGCLIGQLILSIPHPATESILAVSCRLSAEKVFPGYVTGTENKTSGGVDIASQRVIMVAQGEHGTERISCLPECYVEFVYRKTIILI